ncbi:hypothetical protein ASD11_08980 [Aeromicrobium sp. Root495]|uniref:hypothetical protein n=1 Tax=Aeromicrobium sp. Root495 TaxID=1736550 RepID=UPI0006FD84A5|nr:hypothetical protein [Aeromicrobium sp. Root495]KQY59666.1 hypothetical protein ASD11_08980 [Aeromicrobium sp. Root495]
MSRLRILVVAVLVLALTACTVPSRRGDSALGKSAVRPSEVTEVFDNYRDVWATASAVLDPKPLSTVETGAALAIDTGSFDVAQRSGSDDSRAPGPSDVVQVEAPYFTRYPLWFVAVSRNEKTQRVQVFERTSAVDPWLLVDTPEIAAGAQLPELRRREGDALAVKAANGAGMAASPQKAAAAYAAALVPGAKSGTVDVSDDTFRQQMSRTAEQNSALKGVGFSQRWSAEPVAHALRTSDGGALVFATLERLDAYEVQDGVTVTFAQDSPQQAFLQSGISTSGTLRYLHQVLLRVPPGDGPVRALGQYGGVVEAQGF